MDGRIATYIEEHPEVIQKSLMAAQAKQAEQEQARQVAVTKQRASEILTTRVSVSESNASAPITVVEFFDFECPFCKKGLQVVEAALHENSDVKAIYHENPILGGASLPAARAELVAAEFGKYAEFHHAMLADQTPEHQLTEARILEIAKSIGLDPIIVGRKMSDQSISTQVEADMQLAGALGARGTPFFIVMASDGSGEPKIISGLPSEDGLKGAISGIRSQATKDKS
jgi:protein-disulfide isomerase